MSSRLSGRFTGAILTLLLQAGLLALLLQSVTQQSATTPQSLVRELTLVLPRLAKPRASKTPSRRETPSVTAPMPAVPMPPSREKALLAAPPDLSTFGQTLFGCSQETYANLAPDQRAHCPRPGEGYAVQPDPLHIPDHVKDEAHWEAELAHEHSPVWVPCTAPANKPTLADVGIDFRCLMEEASQGQVSDPRQWPIYETQKNPPNDLHKIEQAYDAWHKDHPAAPTAKNR